jgi:hypothetical protein
MTPTANLDRKQVREWLRDLAANPVTPDELRQDPAYDRNSPTQDPEVALTLDSHAIPTWWPLRNPTTSQPMPPGLRRLWCLQAIADELSPQKKTLLSAEPKSRRQTIARCLLLMHSGLLNGEIPTPD